jgi:hypothetical protein
MNRSLFPIYLLILVFASCWNGDRPDDPSAVATAFLRALQYRDLDKARSLATAESAPALALGQEILEQTGDAALREVFEGRWRSAACEGGDDYQTCTVCCAATGMNAALVLVREQGAWKVQLDKSSRESIEQSLYMLGGLFEPVDTIGLDAELDRVIDSLEKAAGATGQ